MRSKKIFAFLMAVVIVFAITACSSEKRATELKEKLLGQTFIYEETTTDDLCWEVNGYRCDESGVLTIHADGSVTKTYKQEYTFDKSSPFKSSFEDINNENTYDSFEVKIEKDRIVMDIEGLGIMEWVVFTDDQDYPYAIRAGVVYEIK